MDDRIADSSGPRRDGESSKAAIAFTADDVKQVLVRVGTNEAAIVNNREIPDISLQHLVAVMLIDKTVSFKSSHDVARMKDPAFCAIAPRFN